MLNHPGDPSNEHGRNLLIDYGQGPNKIDDFFMVAFRILDAQPLGKVNVKAQTRKNVYTKLSDHLVWMDYKRKSTSESENYDLTLPLDIKCQATNSNNMNAYITHVFLRKSSDKAEEKELRPEGTKCVSVVNNVHEYEGGFDKLQSKGRSEEDVSGGIPIEKDSYKTIEGFKIPSTFQGGKLDFFVPFTLDDFYEGYDEIVFKIIAYKRKTDDKGREVIQKDNQESIIEITERELFNLE